MNRCLIVNCENITSATPHTTPHATSPVTLPVTPPCRYCASFMSQTRSQSPQSLHWRHSPDSREPYYNAPCVESSVAVTPPEVARGALSPSPTMLLHPTPSPAPRPPLSIVHSHNTTNAYWDRNRDPRPVCLTTSSTNPNKCLGDSDDCGLDDHDLNDFEIV